AGAVQSEATRYPGHRVLYEGGARPGRRHLAQHVVGSHPRPDLDAWQTPLQLPGELWVAEQQAERVRVHRHFPVREAHGCAVQGKLIPVVVIGAQVPDHLASGQDPERLAAAAVVTGGHGPQVIARGQRRGTVLGGDPVDVLLPLRVHADHGGRLAVRPYDEVTD